MKILVSGGTGLVGTALIEHLDALGHESVVLSRRALDRNSVQWDPAKGELDPSALEGLDAVIHLAGESIAEGRWNAAKKERIRSSRVQGTQLLAKTLAQLDAKPGVFVSASAIGYYGNRAHQILDESSSAGNLFLSDVCRAWEAAAEPAAETGIRTVAGRLGVVITPLGGALSKMLLPFSNGWRRSRWQREAVLELDLAAGRGRRVDACGTE